MEGEPVNYMLLPTRATFNSNLTSESHWMYLVLVKPISYTIYGI